MRCLPIVLNLHKWVKRAHKWVKRERDERLSLTNQTQVTFVLGPSALLRRCPDLRDGAPLRRDLGHK